MQAAHGVQYQTKQNKKTTQSKNEDLEWHFSKEGIQMAKKKKKKERKKEAKDAQHCSLLEKCTSKLQWGISSKYLQTINAEGVWKKGTPSCATGWSTNW